MTPHHVVRAVIALAGAALLIPSPVFAQGVTAGITGGVNVSNSTFKVPDGSFSISPDSRSGLIIGGFVASDFNEKAGLIVEGLFSQKGAMYEFSDAVGNMVRDVRINYVEFPILGRVNLKGSDAVTVHIFGGPSFAFKAGHTVKETVNGVSTTVPEEDEPALEGNDVGLVLGLSVDIRRFVIGARYTWGLMNVNADTGSQEPEVKNRAFAVQFGVNLWSKN